MLILLSGPARTQVVEWQSFTSVGTIRDMDIASGSVWAASSGGVLRLRGPEHLSSKFTNTEGLTANDVVAVEIDRRGSIWFALADGVLNRYFPEQERWEIVQDYQEQQITAIVAFGDSLYLALGIGVSLYTIDKREVKETYTNFGLSSGANVEKIAANSVFLNGTDIWVSTSKGIAKSSITLPNLQAPSSWVQFTTQQGLPSNEISNIVVLGGVSYAATSSGVARQVSGQWQRVGSLTSPIVTLALAQANRFFEVSTVLAVTGNGVFWLDPSDSWQPLGAELDDVTAVAADEAGNVWIGRQNLGLATFDFDRTEWNLFVINGPASDDFKSMTLDSKGRLWCASQVGGIHMLEGSKWRNFSRTTGLPSNDYRTIIEDHDGRIWVGSWGGGITILEETAPDSFRISRIDTSDGVLSAFEPNSAFVLVNGMTRDQADNIWILNRQAVNTRVLASRMPDDTYVHFSTNAGLKSRFVNHIEIDRGGRVWLGTDDQGIQVIDYNGTLSNPSDDDFSQGLTTNDGLFKNEITALAEDLDGTMWIGTVEGLHFWAGGLVGNQFGIINNAITAIGVDGRNNKWIGTINGLTLLRRDRDKIADFAPGNSPLVSGNIQSFAFNENTGEVWIGTDQGLSRAITLFTAPKEDLSQLTGFPNPFVIDGSGRRFTITNLAEDTSVSIYTPSGVLVKSFADEAQVLWDGTDREGNPVASGIYVFLAYTNNNISASGKVAVIRR
ncbi:MAG: two-component regulator propeller domain-containing protein [bacterium]